jgi:CubicO group peptidase (beta-lactamase class C family)
MRRFFKWLGIAFLGLVGVGLIAYLLNFNYMNRYFRMAGAMAASQAQKAEWYEPVDAVPGAPDSPIPMAAPTAPTIDEAALKKAKDYALAMNSDGIIVWHNGAIQSADYFNGFDRTRLLASKSMAKMIVGVVIGRAIAEGHIKSVDQPMSDFITEWKGTPKETPTIRNFLHNSSGLSRFEYNDFKPWSQAMREYLSPYHEKILIDETTYDYEPGSEYDYSMITSDMLAIIIERATGQRYADYVSTALIKPIGAQGGSVYINRPGGLAHSGCCMNLPAESFLRLGQLLMQDGVWEGKRLLPEGWVAETLKPSPAHPNWGLHMWIGDPHATRKRWFAERSQPIGVLHSEPYAARDLFLFDGSGHQVLYIVPSLKLMVLRFGPAPKAKIGTKGEWDNSFLPNTIIRGLKSAPASGESL